MYLPDTNIFIRALHNFEPEATFLKQQISQGLIVISVIVIGEFYPKALIQEKKAFDKLRSTFEVIGIDERIALTASNYRKKALQKNKKVYLLDCFLAAQAKVNKLTLVTNNLADFPMRDIKVINS